MQQRLCLRAIGTSTPGLRLHSPRRHPRKHAMGSVASAAAAAAGPATSANAAPAASPDEVVRRKKGAIMGALAADAATMGLHWIYDRAKLDALLAGGKAPEFYDPPSCPFYKLPSGQLSPYGAETAALLGYYARGGGGASGGGAKGVAEATAAYFKGVYADGYQNKSVKTLIANVDAGNDRTGDASDTQANMICKAAVVAAAYAGSPALVPALDAAVRAQQDSDAAVEYGVGAARLLERVVLGSSVRDAIAWAAKAPEVPERARDAIADAAAAAADGKEPLVSLGARFGISCAMPGALQLAVAVAARAAESAAGSSNAYESAVRENITLGGDNASRACFVGALLGAAAAGAAPPAAWAAKVADAARFESEADVVVKGAAAASAAGQS